MDSRKAFEMWPIDWSDGQLVRADHLIHSDKRLDYLLAESLNIQTRSFGIFEFDTSHSADSSICEWEKMEDSNQEKITHCTIRAHISGVTPNGAFVRLSGMGRDRTTGNWARIAVNVASSIERDHRYLLCLSSSESEIIRIDHPINPEIKLRVSKIIGEVVAEHDFDISGNAKHCEMLPIARFSVSANEKFENDADYIPAFTNLAIAEKFKPGAVSNIRNQLLALEKVLTDNLKGLINEQMQSNSKRDIAKYALIGTLLQIIYSNKAMLAELKSCSCTYMNRNLTQPLGFWANSYMDVILSSSERNTQYVECNRLLALLPEFHSKKLYSGCGEFLSITSDLLTQVRRFFTF